MKKEHFYFIGTALILFLIMGTKKAFANITLNQKIRGCDPFGCGSFGAPRGTRSHAGVDIVVTAGQKILSPIDGTVTRHPFPYGDDLKFTGIEIKNSQYLVKIFYLQPTLNIGSKVKQGQQIGVAQNIASKYGSTMTNHVHFEVYNAQGKLLDPTNLF